MNRPHGLSFLIGGKRSTPARLDQLVHRRFESTHGSVFPAALVIVHRHLYSPVKVTVAQCVHIHSRRFPLWVEIVLDVLRSKDRRVAPAALPVVRPQQFEKRIRFLEHALNIFQLGTPQPQRQLSRVPGRRLLQSSVQRSSLLQLLGFDRPPRPEHVPDFEDRTPHRLVASFPDFIDNRDVYVGLLSEF